MTKTTDKTLVRPGDQITYTIHYQNTGQTKAQDVIIKDTIPNGTNYIQGSANPSPADFINNTLSWQYSAITGKGQGEIEFKVRVE